MAVVGIVAEYNPFHLGHAYQIAATGKALRDDAEIVCVMSGNYVQRGEPAILDKHTRAEAAVRCGADLVLELPTPWASAGAERFARGAISLLHAAGVVEYLSFGSESGDLGALQRVADVLDSPDFPEVFRVCRMDPGRPFAAARQLAVAELAGADAAACLERPNDILGIEYLRALRYVGSAIRPLAIRRLGAAHDGEPVEGVASASAIRQMIVSGEDPAPYLPRPMLQLLEREKEGGRAPVDSQLTERAVLSRLRMMGEEDFALYDQGGEGLANRVFHAARAASSLRQLLELAKTRRYPAARLRRMILHAWLDIRLGELPPLPPYIRVLAIGRRGRRLLRQMKERAALPVVTRPGEAKKLAYHTADLFSLEARCTDLYTLAWPIPAPPGLEYLRGPVVLDDDEVKNHKEE